MLVGASVHIVIWLCVVLFGCRKFVTSTPLHPRLGGSLAKALCSESMDVGSIPAASTAFQIEAKSENARVEREREENKLYCPQSLCTGFRRALKSPKGSN